MQDLDTIPLLVPPAPRAPQISVPSLTPWLPAARQPVVVSVSGAGSAATADLAVALLASHGRPAAHSLVLVVGPTPTERGVARAPDLSDVILRLQRTGADVAYHDRCTPVLQICPGVSLRSVSEPLPEVDLVIVNEGTVEGRPSRLPEAPLLLLVQ